MSYNNYLKSNYWKKRREEFKIKTWGRCFICHSRKKLNVHHKRYNSLGKEKHTDLRLLCEECQHKIHKYKLERMFASNLIKRRILRDYLKNLS